MYFLGVSVVLYLASAVLFLIKTFANVDLKNLHITSLLTAFFFYLLHFFSRYFSTGHFPVGDPYSMVSLMGNFIVLIFLILFFFFKRNIIDFGFIIAFLGFLTTFVGLPAKEVGYKNPFYVYHILSAGISYASLILGGIVSAVKLIVERKLRTKHIEGFMIPVNPLRKMERILINTGFIFLTLTLIFGSLWAKNFLGRHWINDPKLILTLILWLYYAFLVHINLVKGLKPSRLSIFSFLGSLFVVANIIFIRHSL